jgi:hypothetical protein
MSRYLWSTITGLIAAITTIHSGAVGIAAASGSDPQPTEVRLERRIAAELERGQVAAARVEAEAALKRYPESAVLRRRHAQVELCRAIQQGEQFQQVLDDATWAQNLGRVVSLLHKGHGWMPELTAEQREQFEQFRLFASGPVVTRFQEQALQKLADSQPLLDQRSQALSATFEELKAARRLGDTGTELELTELWSQVIVLLWREQPAKLQPLGTARVAAVTKALAPFESIQPEALLRAVAALAKQQPTDPTALAGAADVVSVVAGITKKPDPLREHLRKVLDRPYYRNGVAYEPQINQAVREGYRELYLQMRDAKDLDVVRAPATVALQLYQRALEQDAGYALPYLRLRLYLLRLAFEPEAARLLLEEIRKREPGNAVVPLEEARATLRLEGKPLQAIRTLQEATRYPVFSRSYLVAPPAVLRPTLKFQSELREWIGQAWPGYHWLFGTLMLMQHPRGSPGLMRAEQQLYERLGEQVDLPGLEVRLAERLCQAPDYADQAAGIQETLSKLGFLVAVARQEKRPPEEQATLKGRLAEQQRAFAAFPRQRSMLWLSAQGLDFLESPTAGRAQPQDSWPRLCIGEPGYFMFWLARDLPTMFHQAKE